MNEVVKDQQNLKLIRKFTQIQNHHKRTTQSRVINLKNQDDNSIGSRNKEKLSDIPDGHISNGISSIEDENESQRLPPVEIEKIVTSQKTANR